MYVNKMVLMKWVHNKSIYDVDCQMFGKMTVNVNISLQKKTCLT